MAAVPSSVIVITTSARHALHRRYRAALSQSCVLSAGAPPWTFSDVASRPCLRPLCAAAVSQLQKMNGEQRCASKVATVSSTMLSPTEVPASASPSQSFAAAPGRESFFEKGNVHFCQSFKTALQRMTSVQLYVASCLCCYIPSVCCCDHHGCTERMPSCSHAFFCASHSMKIWLHFLANRRVD